MADHCASILRPRRWVCLHPASFELLVSDRPPRRPLCDCFEHAQNFTATMASMAMSERPMCHPWKTTATVRPPFCLQRRPGQFCGRTREAQRSQPLCKGGINKGVLLWTLQVSIWATLLPSLYHHCASFGRPVASIERSLWRPLYLHSATTATLESPWQWFCLRSASFARPVMSLQQLRSFKEGTRVVLQQLHRNRTFWVWATTERPDHFPGGSKVAALCKGAFTDLHFTLINFVL